MIDKAELGQARQIGDVLEDRQVELYWECSFSRHEVRDDGSYLDHKAESEPRGDLNQCSLDSDEYDETPLSFWFVYKVARSTDAVKGVEKRHWLKTC